MERQSPPLVALGDSITWGYPDGPEHGWVARVAAALEVPILNHGINGDTLAGMRARLPLILAEIRPVAVIVTGGVNDVAVGRRVPDMCTDLGAMVEAIAASGGTPILGMPTPILTPELERPLLAFRQFIQSLAGTRHLRAIPFQRALCDASGRPRSELFLDECHPNADGFESMARLILDGEYLRGIFTGNISGR